MGAAPAFFAKSATLYNPLIYIGFNRQVSKSKISAKITGFLFRHSFISYITKFYNVNCNKKAKQIFFRFKSWNNYYKEID